MKTTDAVHSHGEILSLHETRKEEIRRKLDQFTRVASTDYFYELAYCLLTPQSSAANAGKVIEALRSAEFLEADVDPIPLLRRKEYYIRFHNTKSQHLRAMKSGFPAIAQRLSNGCSGPELREWLVANVKGLGLKEASHFLRNIGYRDLAILDRHILRNLIRFGVIRRIPVSLTAKRYKSIEKKFLVFSRKIGIPMDELDLLFWSMETGEILK